MRIVGFVNLKSSLNLTELAKLVSTSISAGIKFGGLDEHLREEVPAVYSLDEFLGLRLVLFGGEGEYGLSVEQWDDDLFKENSDEDLVDLSPYLEYLLSKVEGVTANS